IWTYASTGWANRFFDRWYAWAIRSQITPMKKKATATSGKHHLLRRRLSNILNYFKHFVTIAISEGFNSSIQAVKSPARGFRKLENFRIRILLYCGKLNLMPVIPSH
ncbi:MAG: transposase, partial [Planctomycetota bacterium]|nr:transposase [Planctomycetota bacterium]